MSWAQENGTEPVGGAWGTFPREKMIAMDMQAQVRMLREHEGLCNPHVRHAILKAVAKRNFAKAEAERIAEQDRAILAMVELTTPAEPIPADAFTCHDMALVAATAFGLGLWALKSPRRVRRYVRCRQTAMWLCRRFTSKTWYTIGKAMGGTDHSTAMHADETVQHIINALNLDGGEDPKRWAELLASLTQEEWTAARRSQATAKMRRAA